jgi:hypothetical protein
LIPDVLTVAGPPAIVVSLVLLAFLLLLSSLLIAGVPAVAFVLVD